MLRPQRLCRHHDQERGGGRRHFGRAAVQALPLQGRALCRDPRGGVRGRSGFRAPARPGAVDAHAGRTDQGHGRPFHGGIRRVGSGGSAAAAADDDEPSRRRRVRAAALRQDRRPDRAGVHRIDRKRGRGRRRGADRQRSAQPVLVRPSHRADVGADAASGRALSFLRQRRRSGAAALSIHPARHRT